MRGISGIPSLQEGCHTTAQQQSEVKACQKKKPLNFS